MAKVHHTQYKKLYKNYILDCLEDEMEANATRIERIKYLFNRFNNEYGWHVKNVGKQKAIAEWLQGCAIPIDIWNDEIIKMAITFGSIDENPSDKLKNKVLDNYWFFMANIILDLETELESVEA